MAAAGVTVAARPPATGSAAVYGCASGDGRRVRAVARRAVGVAAESAAVDAVDGQVDRAARRNARREGDGNQRSHRRRQPLRPVHASMTPPHCPHTAAVWPWRDGRRGLPTPPAARTHPGSVARSCRTRSGRGCSRAAPRRPAGRGRGPRRGRASAPAAAGAPRPAAPAAPARRPAPARRRSRTWTPHRPCPAALSCPTPTLARTSGRCLVTTTSAAPYVGASTPPCT